ncbi:MAG: hypothetical protein SFY69_01640 [Planctomycetota bacterium]|nr:hypothetical protein [Planctomycetota bacterium]
MKSFLKRAMFGAVAVGVAALPATAFPPGADVVLADVQSITNHGAVSGVYGYTIGSYTCNIGTANLTWANSGTPGLAMNAYRLSDGRLVQIGESFAKLACCAAAGTNSLCAPTCNGAGGSVLGVGCLDIYSSGWNAGQSRLAARSSINPWTGQFSSFSAATGNAIFKRIQVPAAQIGTTAFPNAQYFVEGVYVGTDDAAGNKRNNNASFKRVTVAAGTNAMSITGTTTRHVPAITAWRQHGMGANLVDARVEDVIIDVPAEGRFHAAHKVTDNGNGTWTYDYAVFNLSSDRAGGSITIPVPAGVNVTNSGFNAPMHHSGEIYNNNPWVFERGCNTVTFRTDATVAVNPNANALRWGTMYNFWFTADQPPRTVDATLGLFKAHSPQSVDFAARGPSQPPCDPDINADGNVDQSDIECLAQAIAGNSGCSPCADPDFNRDGNADQDDVFTLEQVVAGQPCP